MDLRFLADDAVIDELRGRVRRARLAQNLSQAALAERAGLGYHTVRRFEADEGTPTLATFVAILRVLDAITALDEILPEPPTDPLALGPSNRRRASKRAEPQSRGWTWGDEQSVDKQ